LRCPSDKRSYDTKDLEGEKLPLFSGLPFLKKYNCPSHRKNIEMVGFNIKIEMRGRRKDFISSPEDGAKKKQKEYGFLNVSFHPIKS
jgi:hypothetical protein